MIQARLEGLEAVIANMRGLTPKLRVKGARAAVRKGANFVRDRAKDNARALDDPNTGESIADNIAVLAAPKELRRTGNVVMRVGVLGGARTRAANASNPGGDTWYWRLLEFGHEGVPARPFLRPALENNVEQVTQIITAELARQVNRLGRQ